MGTRVYSWVSSIYHFVCKVDGILLYLGHRYYIFTVSDMIRLICTTYKHTLTW